MGAPGSCGVCSRRDRAQVDGAHAEGVPVRHIAMRFDIAETNLRRHLKHARPKAKLAPSVSAKLREAIPEPAVPDLTLETLREIGALIPRPFPLVSYVISGCLGINIVGADDAEDEVIYDLFDEGEAMVEALRPPIRPVRASDL